MKLRPLTSSILVAVSLSTALALPHQAQAKNPDQAQAKRDMPTLVANVAATPNPRYAAIWERPQQASPRIARHGLTASQYQAAFNRYTGQGYRLISVSGSGSGSQTRYAAIWEQSSGPRWAARHGMTSSQYQEQFNRYTRDGYRLVHVSGYGSGNQTRYAAIWEQRSGPRWAARHGMTSSQYQEQFNRYTRDGYRLVHVSGYGSGSQTRYAAIWEQSSGPRWAARHGMTSSQYQEQFNRYTRDGYRLVHVSGYGSGSQTRYAAIWEQSSGPRWVARHGMTSSQYQEQFNQYTSQGYQLAHVSGYGQ